MGSRRRTLVDSSHASVRRDQVGLDTLLGMDMTHDEEPWVYPNVNRPPTAGTISARAVVLVEGVSDQLALEALAERRGRNLDAEGISIMPIRGATNIGSFLHRFGPQGSDLRLAGLCDAAQEGDFQPGLERAGPGSNSTRAEWSGFGFFGCVPNPEAGLIPPLGVAVVGQAITPRGWLDRFRSFRNQPPCQGGT